ncbi:MAG: vWA domain-containing protein, partial [Planctomycetota bacterium]
MGLSFGHVEYLHLLWAVPALGLVYWYGFSRKRRALGRFATANLLGHLMPGVSVGRQVFKAALVLAVIALLVVALSGPRWGERAVEVYRPGVDVMVVLDVSRSMLADDCRPNRLEKARQYINDLLEVLPGDRIGLVSFAGKAVLSCPLTPNYGWFRMALEEVDPRLAPRGGSNLAEAVRLAARKLGERTGDHKAILLITDGEDQDSDPQYAARYAFEDDNVRTFAIGLGDAVSGRRIPMEAEGGSSYVKEEDGSEHYSRMNATILESIAHAGGEGFAVPAGMAEIDMAEFYDRMRAKLAPEEYVAQ